jgi:hypothetical protein
MQGIDELLAQAQTTKDTLQKPKEKKTKGSSLLLSFDEEGEENEDE